MKKVREEVEDDVQVASAENDESRVEVRAEEKGIAEDQVTEKGRAGRFEEEKEDEDDEDNTAREMTKAEIRFEQVRRQRQIQRFSKQASTSYRQNLEVSFSPLLLRYPKIETQRRFFLLFSINELTSET